jgi:hypothetical protein
MTGIGRSVVIQRRRSNLSWFLGSAMGAAWLIAFALLVPRPASADLGLSPVEIYPPTPCTDDTVAVLVQGYLPTPCDSFIGAFKVSERKVRIVTQTYFMRQCFAAPFQFFTVPVDCPPDLSRSSSSAGPSSATRRVSPSTPRWRPKP